MVCLPTNSKEIFHTIMTFKNKLSDLDAIRPFIDKGVAISVSPLLSDIINESFTEGVFPDSLMIARVIPLFKSGK